MRPKRNEGSNGGEEKRNAETECGQTRERTRTSSQSRSGNWTAGDLRWMPAQLTRTWMSPPMASSACGKICFTDSRSSRSQWTVFTVRPRAAIASAVAWFADAVLGRTTRQMLAPASARARAQAAPMPGDKGDVITVENTRREQVVGRTAAGACDEHVLAGERKKVERGDCGRRVHDERERERRAEYGRACLGWRAGINLRGEGGRSRGRGRSEDGRESGGVRRAVGLAPLPQTGYFPGSGSGADLRTSRGRPLHFRSPKMHAGVSPRAVQAHELLAFSGRSAGLCVLAPRAADRVRGREWGRAR